VSDPPEATVPPYALAAVRRARDSVERAARGEPELHLDRADPMPAELRAPRGVFVTLSGFPGGRLRGCIGFPLPVFPLHEALAQAARAAALEDPRFPAVGRDELPGLTVEVSILSIPERLPGPPERRAEQVEVGRHGLIAESKHASGLLLPQVAVEERWDARRFLEGTCEKAGLPREAWRQANVQLSRFHAEVFRELRPRGAVVFSGRSAG
jgi:AmmeMemoRadiSam system protein A